MKSHVRGNHGSQLPAGWHKAFLNYFFGVTKGLYTNWPGLAPKTSSYLAFLGVTFTQCEPVAANPESIWSRSFRIPCVDRSWTDPPQPFSENESSDESLALTKNSFKPTQTSDNTHQRVKPKAHRRYSHGVAIQPDEVTEPTDWANQKPKRRYSEHHPQQGRVDGFSKYHGDRSSTLSRDTSRGVPGKQRRQNPGHMSSNFGPIEEPPAEYVPQNPERASQTPRRHRRHSSMNSTTSFSARSTVSQSDSLPRAPSPPMENPPDIPTTPPRKHRRANTGHTSPSVSTPYRSLSPISDYYGENLMSVPLGMASPPNTDPGFYQPPNPYFPPEPSNLSWSGYQTPPNLPPLPSSPSSTFSRMSRQSFPPMPSSPTNGVIENVEGEFTLKSVLSVSETSTGRFYKVRWVDTWESKLSLRKALESGKYNVQETLESTYLHGKPLYLVRWEDTWESEEEIGGTEPVMTFWERVAAGELES